MIGKKEGLAPTTEDKDSPLGRFAIAGSDKVWHWADAVIDGKTVVVSSKDVENREACVMAGAGTEEGSEGS